MSKLLRKQKEMLPEENSEQISQIAATVATGVSEADLFAYLAIGSANKRWINGQLEGQFPAPYQSYTTGTWVNTGATDYRLVFGVPLPFIINGKNLYLTNVKVGIHDADGANYLDRVFMNGATDHDTQSAPFLDDGTNRIAAAEHIYVINELIGGVYEKVSIQLFVFATNAGNFDLSYCQFEYYYT